MLKLIETWAAKRQAIAGLSRLSDRSLADVGIARADIATLAASAVEAQIPPARDAASPRLGHAPAWA